MRLKLLVFFLSMLLLSVYIPYSLSDSSECITFTKYYPDGHIVAIRKNVDFDGDNRKNEEIANICKDFLYTDPVFQNYMQNASENLNIIISGGYGLHINFPSSFFRSSAFDIIFSLFPSLVYCNYQSDASTTIFPLTSPDNSTDIVGEHKLLCVGFMGVIGWSNIISRTDTGFAGLTLYYLLL